MHPDAARRKPLYDIVLAFDPGKPFRMGQHGNAACQKDIEKQILDAGRGDMVERLHQNVGRIGKRKEMPAFEPCNKVRNDVIVGSSRKPERNSRIVKPRLQFLDRLPDLGPGVVVKARQNVRCAGDTLDPLIHISASHRQGCLQIGGPVVDSRKQMTMKIEHRIPIPSV